MSNKEIETSERDPDELSSGRSTPKLSDSVTSDNSSLDYEVERNWSVIFTDDNNSTDHDIRSNYSSSVDDNELETELDSNTEAEGGSSPRVASGFDNGPYINSRRGHRTDTSSTLKPLVGNSSFLESSESASVSTIRPEKHEDLLQLPDPIASNRNENKSTHSPLKPTDDIKSNLSAGWKSLKNYAIYGIVALLVLDRSLEVFDLSPFFNSIQGDSLANDELSKKGDSYSPHTIIRYATKTQTLFVPGTTVTYQTTFPKETVYEYVTDIDDSSLKSAKKLFENIARDLDVVGKAAWDSFKDTTAEASRYSREKVEIIKESSFSKKLESKSKSVYKTIFEETDYQRLVGDGFTFTKEFSHEKLNDFKNSKFVENVKFTVAKTSEVSSSKLSKFVKDSEFLLKKDTWVKFIDQQSGSIHSIVGDITTVTRDKFVIIHGKFSKEYATITKYLHNTPFDPNVVVENGLKGFLGARNKLDGFKNTTSQNLHEHLRNAGRAANSIWKN